MFTIRNHVFETNSSSSHSMCITNSEECCIDRDHVTNLMNGDGVWVIGENYYGRSPVMFLDTFSDKVLYYLAVTGGNSVSKVESIVMKYFPKFTGFKTTDKYYGYGYAENTGFLNWMKTNNISLEDLLTKKKYSIITDGDEYQIFTDMIKCGIIREDIKIDTSWDG